MENFGEIKQYKVMVVGDGGCGKTTAIQRIKSKEFERRYIPTIGVEVVPIVLFRNGRQVVLNLWDCAGQEKFGVLRGGYHIGAAGVVVMLQKNNQRTARKAAELYQEVINVAPNAVSVIVGTMGDLAEDGVEAPIGKNRPYYIISTKESDGLTKVLEDLADMLLANDLPIETKSKTD